MMRLSALITRFRDAFLASYGHRLTTDHLRALAALQRCRTEASGKMELACGDCPHKTYIPHSCGHRHCPHCQHHESQQWLERQLEKQLPIDYFLLTFTVPAELRSTFAAQPKQCYELLLRASWETVRTFSQNDKRLRGTPGAIAVLHTHTRRLDYHPHVHIVMPAGAVDFEHKQWRAKQREAHSGDGQRKGNYLFSQKALAKVFRAKLLAAVEAAGLPLPPRYPAQWVVDCKSVGNGEKALLYLGRYLYRGVIREQDIIACEDGQVRFRYRDGRTGKSEVRTVPGAQFLWLVLQHVLPKGFRRARNFGFLHPNSKRLITLLQVLLKFIPPPVPATVRQRPTMLCACCGTPMRVIRTRLAPAMARPEPPPMATGAN